MQDLSLDGVLKLMRIGHIGLTLVVFAPVVLVLAVVGAVFAGLGLVNLGVWLLYLVLFQGLGLLFSFIPDFDIYFQKAGVGIHRGETHTVWWGIEWSIAFSVYPIVGAILSAWMWYGGELEFAQYALDCLVFTPFAFFGVFLGLLSHLLGDAMTISGIRPFMPYDDTKIAWKWFRSSNLFINFGFFFLGLLFGGVVWSGVFQGYGFG